MILDLWSAFSHNSKITGGQGLRAVPEHRARRIDQSNVSESVRTTSAPSARSCSSMRT
jgi:hypothetical protein